jgi:hypothetical protein
MAMREGEGVDVVQKFPVGPGKSRVVYLKAYCWGTPPPPLQRWGKFRSMRMSFFQIYFPVLALLS